MKFAENLQKPQLKIIPIGGTTTVQKNMYVYECGNDILVFDCGVGFPDFETPGVDLIIPDFTYILENRDKVRGIVITHGHDDHRSSLPFLLREHRFPVYAVKLVKLLIEKGLEEHSDLTNVKINEMSMDVPLKLGNFTLYPFRVNHSIPDTLGFAVDTPQGRVFHNTDFKFDFTPVMDKPFDIQRAARLASERKHGVLALLSDCLGATSEGYAKSEKVIEGIFENIFKENKNKQIFITTISSNISRVKQAIEVSLRYNRKIVISGRSLKNTINVARELKYIDFKDNIFVDEKKASKMDQSKLTYFVPGAYGQKGSGLWRLAFDEHKTLSMTNNSVIVFSADPIPNSVTAVNAIIDELYLKGAEIYYSEIQNNLHVSGHGLQGDMVLLANIVKPRYFIPIGGNIKHMRAYSKLIQSLGIEANKVFQLMDGESIVFDKGQAFKGERLKLKEVYVDGNLVGDVGARVIEERIKMSSDGMVVVTISKNSIDIVTRGFIFVKESKKLINEIEQLVKSVYSKHSTKQDIKSRIERELERFLFRATGRNPLITISII